MTDDPARMGRPPHKRDAKIAGIIETLASVGNNQEIIARVIKLDPKTMRKHYLDELELSRAKIVAQIGANLFKTALGRGLGSVTAGIFVMKTLGGWKDTASVEIAGPGGAPIKVSHDGFTAFADGLDAYALAKASGALEAQGMAGVSPTKPDHPV